MKRSVLLLVIVSGLALVLSACGGTGELTVSDAWSRPAMEAGNGAIYFVIDNDSGVDDVLLFVETAVAEVVEMHNVIMVDPNADEHEDDGHEHDEDDAHDVATDDMVMKMVPQENVSIAQGEKLSFKPGSYHVMLIHLKQALKEGEMVTLTLHFENAGDITVEAVVENR